MKQFEAIIKDKNHKKLLEPIDIETGKKIKVIIQEESDLENEREDLLNLSQNTLNRIYGENEPEYKVDMIKEKNEDYKL